LNTHLKAALLAFVLLCIVASVWVIIVIALFPVAANDPFPNETVLSAPHNSTVSTWLVKPWMRWDTEWFTSIGREGYSQENSSAYLPLYPALVGLLGRVLAGEYLLAAILISNLFLVAALALLHKLVQDHYDERTANFALFYLVVFPTSYYLVAAYTESLFLALILAAFVLADRDRWLLAATCGALAILTRWQGAALVPALGMLALARGRRAVFSLGIMPLAFVGIVAFFWHLGDADILPWRVLQTSPG
jgi:Gpi18-like mannosyltransferase